MRRVSRRSRQIWLLAGSLLFGSLPAGAMLSEIGLAPLPHPLHDAAIGHSDGVWLIIGGVRDADTRPVAGVWVLRDASGSSWDSAGQLDTPLADAASVTDGLGIILIGGWDGRQERRDVRRLRWDAENQSLIFDTLPDLPHPLRGASAAVLGDRLYVAGGVGAGVVQDTFWMLDLAAPDARWRALDSWPGPARHDAVIGVQRDGYGEHVFLFGGSDVNGQPLFDAYRYTPAPQSGVPSWTSLGRIPGTPVGRRATRLGQSHLLVLTQTQPDGAGLGYAAYHVITDTWRAMGGIKSTADIVGLTAMGGHTMLLTAEGASLIESPRPRAWFRVIDYAVLVVYLLSLVGIGWYFSKRGKTTKDFFLAGKRIPWWAAALSLMATQVSSIGFMAIPSKSYTTNWVYFAGVATWFVVVPIVTRMIIPFFCRLSVTSAYEYLETRFNLFVRLFASLTFILMELGRIAVVLYLPALALSAVTGLDIYLCIAVMGVLATAYTAAGGMEAVVWTDVVQAGVLIGGALLCVLVVIFSIDGGPARAFEVAWRDSKFQLVEPGWDFASTALWVVLLGSAFGRLATFTSNQSVVQRYLTTSDEKQAAKALWGDAMVSIPWAIIVFALGTALYVFYKEHPESLNPAIDNDGIVAFFVAQQLPAGVSGLVIAGIFAAAMSSLDSGIHSSTTAVVVDFYHRLIKRTTDRGRLILARSLIVVLGAFGTGTALLMATTDIRSLWDLFISILGLFSGVLCGLFLLGIFTRRANGSGAVVGAIVAAAVQYWTSRHTSINFFLYPVVGIVTCCVVGYVASFFLPGRPRIEGLTIFSMPWDAPRPNKPGSLVRGVAGKASP